MTQFTSDAAGQFNLQKQQLSICFSFKFNAILWCSKAHYKMSCEFNLTNFSFARFNCRRFIRAQLLFECRFNFLKQLFELAWDCVTIEALWNRSTTVNWNRKFPQDLWDLFCRKILTNGKWKKLKNPRRWKCIETINSWLPLLEINFKQIFETDFLKFLLSFLYSP